MTQSLNHANTRDAEAAALRQRIRRALASDLQLPERDPAVTATMRAIATVARHRVSGATTSPAPVATLDTWWRIVAHAHALNGRQ